MWAVMLAMKTMLPPPLVGGGWDWWCLTKSWAAKKEPRDCVFCVSWIFFFFSFFFFPFFVFFWGEMYHTLTSRTLETSLQVWSTKGLSIAMPAAVTRPSILPNDCTAFSNAVYELSVSDPSDETRY